MAKNLITNGFKSERKNIMEWMSNNWFNIVGLIIILLAAFFAGKKYMEKDKAQKIEAIKEWLKYAVTVTEKALGSNTGKLKLQMIWSMATAQFPFITKVITFEQFSKMVDDALDWMKEQLEANPNIKAVVTGIKDDIQ